MTTERADNMTIDTKRLRELAEKATPGPWAHYGTEPFEVYDSKEYSNGEPGPYVAKWVRDYDDTAYIAATDPQTVIALLDEIDRLRDIIERVDDIIVRHYLDMSVATDVLPILGELNE